MEYDKETGLMVINEAMEISDAEEEKLLNDKLQSAEQVIEGDA